MKTYWLQVRTVERKLASLREEYERRVGAEEAVTGISEEQWRKTYDSVKSKATE